MKRDTYQKFAECWNLADFSSFSNKLLKDCTYSSFDYFYKLKGKERVIELLESEAAKNHSNKSSEKINIHKGYYQKSNSMLKSIKECCIMVRQSDLKTTRILIFNKRFCKVASISGLDPSIDKSIRDKKL